MKTIKDLDETGRKAAIAGALMAHGGALNNPTAKRFLAMQKRMEEEKRPKVVQRNLRD